MTKRGVAAGLMAVWLGTGALAAPPPPPVETRVAPPPPIMPVSPPVRTVPDCSTRASVPFGDENVRLCLFERRGWLWLRTANTATGAVYRDTPAEVENLLGLLASPRAAALWPQIEAFVGPDGEGLRRGLRRRADELLASGYQQPRDGSPLENFFGGSVLATLQAAELYWQSGDLAKANALLRDKRAELETLGLAGNPSLQFSWLSLMLRNAKLLVNSGKLEQGLTVLREAAAQTALDPKLRSNALVNHAAILAEYGQPKDSLAILALAEQAAGPKGNWVPGSERQFSWIRACALKQLGDAKGAEKARQVITRAAPALRRGGGTIASTDAIELRLAYCVGDDVTVARLLGDGAGYAYEPAWQIMQSAVFSFIPGKDATRQRAAQRLQTGAQPPRVRTLPAGLGGAMNAWLSPPPDLRAVPVPAAAGTRG